MKHTHVLPPYSTLRVFSLTQVPNVDGSRDATPKVSQDKFLLRMAAANKMRSDFYDWGRKNGPSAIGLLEEFLRDNQPEGQPLGERTRIVGATFHQILKDSRESAEKCKMSHGKNSHEEMHALDTAAVGILFGIFLQQRITEEIIREAEFKLNEQK